MSALAVESAKRVSQRQASALTPVSASLWTALFEPEAPPLQARLRERSGLAKIADWREFAAESLLLAREEAAPGLLALTEGDVALGLRRTGGEFRVDRHLRGPAWLEVSAGWLGGALPQDMLALSDARVMVLPREPLFEWADQTPGVWPLLGSVLARELGLSRELCHRLMHKDAPARFALWLLQHLALSAPAAGRSVVVLPTRKRDLASELAITPETLSRLMRRFVDEGLIRVVGYTLHVLDRDGLRACAESDS